VSDCVFILVGGIKRFIVLDAVERMVEREKLDRNLRQDYNEAEDYIRSLTAMLADLSNGANSSTLGDSDTGATQRSWS
jgi:hypothetical protein